MTVVMFTVCFTSTFYYLCYVPKRSLHIWGVSRMLEYIMLSLPQVSSTIFLGFLIYWIGWGMPKTQSWTYRGLLIGRTANHAAASFQHCLHGGWFDRCFGLAGHTLVAHIDLNVLLCIMTLELLHKIFLWNYLAVSVTVFFFFNSNLRIKKREMTACRFAWKG